jgi:hypothetical protein
MSDDKEIRTGTRTYTVWSRVLHAKFQNYDVSLVTVLISEIGGKVYVPVDTDVVNIRLYVT